MMGERRVMQEALFYGFSLDRHVPDNHMLRRIDRFVDLLEVRVHLAPYYGDVGRPSIDPELLIRMLLVGYCFRRRAWCRLAHSASFESLDKDAPSKAGTKHLDRRDEPPLTE